MTNGTGLLKPASRFLGVAESGLIGERHSILGGVVMRADLIIDGIIWTEIDIGGFDASSAIVSMVQDLARDDLNAIILHGTVIAGYNIIDLAEVVQGTKLPVISVTREPQEDLQKHLISTFPKDWKSRWEISQRNGNLHALTLEQEHSVYIQFSGCNWNEVKAAIRRLTRFGGIPEPIRVARLLARTVIRKQMG